MIITHYKYNLYDNKISISDKSIAAELKKNKNKDIDKLFG